MTLTTHLRHSQPGHILKCISIPLQHGQICLEDVVQFLAEIPAVQGGRCSILSIQSLHITVEEFEQGTQQIGAMFQQLIPNIPIGANSLAKKQPLYVWLLIL